MDDDGNLLDWLSILLNIDVCDVCSYSEYSYFCALSAFTERHDTSTFCSSWVTWQRTTWPLSHSGVREAASTNICMYRRPNSRCSSSSTLPGRQHREWSELFVLIRGGGLFIYFKLVIEHAMFFMQHKQPLSLIRLIIKCWAYKLFLALDPRWLTINWSNIAVRLIFELSVAVPSKKREVLQKTIAEVC